MANPKGKKNISLTVPIETGLTGKDLKKGISQLIGLFSGLVEKGINLTNFQDLAKDLDADLIKKLESVCI